MHRGGVGGINRMFAGSIIYNLCIFMHLQYDSWCTYLCQCVGEEAACEHEQNLLRLSLKEVDVQFYWFGDN